MFISHARFACRSFMPLLQRRPSRHQAATTVHATMASRSRCRILPSMRTGRLSTTPDRQRLRARDVQRQQLFAVCRRAADTQSSSRSSSRRSMTTSPGIRNVPSQGDASRYLGSRRLLRIKKTRNRERSVSVDISNRVPWGVMAKDCDECELAKPADSAGTAIWSGPEIIAVRCG